MTMKPIDTVAAIVSDQLALVRQGDLQNARHWLRLGAVLAELGIPLSFEQRTTGRVPLRVIQNDERISA